MLKYLKALAVAGLLSFPAMAAETRDVVVANGTVAIPADPQRIVSLHDLSITLPLVEFGGAERIAGSHGRVDAQGQPFIRTVNQLYGVDYHNSSIAFIGVQNQIDLEAIAALEPDLIIGRAGSDDALLANLEKLAPTILIDVVGLDYFERMRAIADVANLTGEYERRLAAYEAQIAEAQRLIPNAGDISVSLIQPWPADGYINGSRFYYALSQALDDIGFAKPAIIAELDGDDGDFSAEFLPELDADFAFSSYETANADQASPDLIRAGFEKILPNYCDVLHACRNNQHVIVARSPIYAASFRSLEIATDLIVTHIAGRQFVPFEP